LGLLGIAWLGWWFHRSFVRPVQDIALASSSVTRGDLSVSVPNKHTQTEMRVTVNNFNRMIRQLRTDEQLRNSFISSLTHDLRTPLLAERRVIELFTEFKDELSPQFQTLTVNLADSNDHLLQMVNRLLETFKYEAGREALELYPVHLPTLVRDCISKLEPLATSKQVRLHMELPEDLPLIHADGAQLERLFINLIGNAIENIPPVGDKVWIRGQWDTAEAAEAVEIRISDNGPGIPEEVRDNLFVRYPTGHRAQKIGSGLGLYICKMIIERHGGKISLDRHQQKGTTFILQLFQRPPAQSALITSDDAMAPEPPVSQTATQD